MRELLTQKSIIYPLVAIALLISGGLIYTAWNDGRNRPGLASAAPVSHAQAEAPFIAQLSTECALHAGWKDFCKCLNDSYQGSGVLDPTRTMGRTHFDSLTVSAQDQDLDVRSFAARLQPHATACKHLIK